MLSAPEPLDQGHDLSDFSCGKTALDTWLKTRALRNHQRGFSTVVVVHEEGRVVGFYGLAPTAVSARSAPRVVRTGQPPEPLPCILLGQLAVATSHAGLGIGASLLRHALDRCLTGAKLIGGRAVVVHGLDDDAAAFWRRWGFTPSPDNPLMMFRSIAAIEASVR